GLLKKSLLRHREAAKRPWRSREIAEHAGSWIAASAFGLLAMTPLAFFNILLARDRFEESRRAFSRNVDRALGIGARVERELKKGEIEPAAEFHADLLQMP